jgi:hypothetical protein
MNKLTPRDHHYYLSMGELDALNCLGGWHFSSTDIPFTGDDLDKLAEYYGAGYPYFLKGDALAAQKLGFKRAYVKGWNDLLGRNEAKIIFMAEALACRYIEKTSDFWTLPLDATFDAAVKSLVFYRAYIPDFSDMNELFITSFVREVASRPMPRPAAGREVDRAPSIFRKPVRKPSAI